MSVYDYQYVFRYVNKKSIGTLEPYRIFRENITVAIFSYNAKLLAHCVPSKLHNSSPRKDMIMYKASLLSITIIYTISIESKHSLLHNKYRAQSLHQRPQDIILSRKMYFSLLHCKFYKDRNCKAFLCS